MSDTLEKVREAITMLDKVTGRYAMHIKLVRNELIGIEQRMEREEVKTIDYHIENQPRYERRKMELTTESQRKKVLVDGKEYRSIADAARSLGVVPTTVRTAIIKNRLLKGHKVAFVK